MPRFADPIKDTVRQAKADERGRSTKVCSVCLSTKPAYQFNGTSRRCRDCQNEDARMQRLWDKLKSSGHTTVPQWPDALVEYVNKRTQQQLSGANLRYSTSVALELIDEMESYKLWKSYAD